MLDAHKLSWVPLGLSPFLTFATFRIKVGPDSRVPGSKVPSLPSIHNDHHPLDHQPETCPSPCGDPHWGNGASAQLSGKTSENSLVARMRCRILLLTVVVLITLPHGVAAACSAN
eukprot:406955-Rhodomonas_salina.1